jgi:hypothetical protein
MKEPKEPSAPKKRGRGRPRKDAHGRKGVFVYLPVDLLAELDAHVAALRQKKKGVGAQWELPGAMARTDQGLAL